MATSTDTITPEQVRAALRRPLLGIPGQIRMAPQPRAGTERILDPDLDCRRAAVLVLLYPRGADLRLVLTRRSEAVNSHQREISLPGGSVEPDESLVETALREAYEEVGVDPGRLEILGPLSPIYVAVSGFCIHPVVAYSPQPPAFTPSAVEVAEVLEVPLAHLLDTNTCETEVWELHGQPTRVPFYRVGPHKVWGATAMILCEFLALIEEAEK